VRLSWSIQSGQAVAFNEEKARRKLSHNQEKAEASKREKERASGVRKLEHPVREHYSIQRERES
jgi:hypothetical protein